MDLLNKALYDNSFGLRKLYPWKSSSYDTHLQILSDRDERKRVLKYIGPVFSVPRAVTIKRVENSYLWGRYVLRYEEMKADPNSRNVAEHIMVHATTHHNALLIAEENFNWRLVRRSRFGQGVSFAKDPLYARMRASYAEAYVIAGVLIANRTSGSWGQLLPPEGYDTTTGYTTNVCIKYYDDDFYPYYIVNDR